MLSEEKKIILRVVERYVRTGSTDDELIKVTCLPEHKTSTVEQIGDQGRSILLDEYRVDGKAIWAGYSVRSGVVFLSLAHAN
jgi:hypothetical protein